MGTALTLPGFEVDVFVDVLVLFEALDVSQ